MVSNSNTLLRLPAAIMLIFIANSLWALETTYTGANYGYWNVSTNWSAGLPTSGKDAVIPVGKIVKYTGLTANFKITNRGSILGDAGTNQATHFLKIQSYVDNYGYIECNGALFEVSGYAFSNYAPSGQLSVGLNAAVNIAYGGHIENYKVVNFSGNNTGNSVVIGSNGGINNYSNSTFQCSKAIQINGTIYGTTGSSIYLAGNVNIKGNLNISDGVLMFPNPTAQVTIQSGTVPGKLSVGNCGSVQQLCTITNNGEVNNSGAFYANGVWSGLPITQLSRKALLVYGGTTLSAGDLAIKNKLVQMGFEVTLKTSALAVTADATDKRLVVLSNTSNSGYNSQKFKGVATGVICLGASQWVGMEMTTINVKSNTNNKVTFGTLPQPICYGVQNSQVILTQSKALEGSTTSGNVMVVARLQDSYQTPMAFAFRKGATMALSVVAPGRRSALGVLSENFPALDYNGWRLFADMVEFTATKGCNENVQMRANAADMVQFGAEKGVNAVNLHWTNLDTDGGGAYAVEKLDPTTGLFQSIKQVAGDFSPKYAAQDNQPLDGSNIYRLKYTDFEGQEVYSKEVEVVFAKDFGVLAYPNPASDAVTLDLTRFVGEQQVRIELVDQQGRVAVREIIDIVEQPVYDMALSQLQNGLYFIQVSSKSHRSAAIKLAVVSDF